VQSPKIVKVPTDFICQAAPQLTGTLKGDKAHPGVFDNSKIKRLVPEFACRKSFRAGVGESVAWLRAHPDQAKALANQDIGRLTGQGLSPQVLDQAWNRMEVTYDPLTSTLVTQAQAAQRAGFVKGPFDLAGLTDLSLLNQVLTAQGLSPIP